MKPWVRHFVLGICMGAITVIAGRAVLRSIPGYDEDSNLLVTLCIVMAYGAGTAVLGAILMRFDRKS